ncbi:MAG: hypothetical protein KGO02_07330 [Alphaproteobacteria bacterium]|nr:hypothetical protein [Alphaproteobacteria bacterium]
MSGGSDNSALAGDLESALQQGASAVLSVGLCGGLEPGLRPGTVILATTIADGATHFACDRRWREAIHRKVLVVEGPLAGSDRILDQPKDKTALRAATGALAVDLESHIAARIAIRHALPVCALRVIADGAGHRLPPAVHVAMTAEGTLSLPRVLGSILRQPAQIGDLIATGRRANTAFSSLFRSLRLLGVGFGCPYLG